MVVVAAANAYTCDLLLWQAYKTGKHDYETLSYAVGGGLWKVCILPRQKSLLLLSEPELQACTEPGLQAAHSPPCTVVSIGCY